MIVFVMLMMMMIRMMMIVFVILMMMMIIIMMMMGMMLMVKIIMMMIMTYSRRCIPCAIEYDVIIKFEHLEEDSEYLIEQCHLEDVLEIKHENPAPTGPRTAQVIMMMII